MLNSILTTISTIVISLCLLVIVAMQLMECLTLSVF
jgi:hypothetical protein